MHVHVTDEIQLTAGRARAEKMSNDDEGLRRLLDDEDFQKASELGHSLKGKINECIKCVNRAVKQLTELKEAVEKSLQ